MFLFNINFFIFLEFKKLNKVLQDSLITINLCFIQLLLLNLPKNGTKIFLRDQETVSYR